MSADAPASQPRASATRPVPTGWFAAGLGSLAALTVVASLPGAVWHYLAVQWSFSYLRGFRRRALLGSVVQVLLGDRPVTPSVVAVAALLILAVVVAGVVWLATVAWARRPTLDTLLVACALVVSPGALKFLAAEHGRLDQVIYALVAVGLVWLVVSRSTRGALPMAGMAVLGVAGAAVHEAFLLCGLPVLAAAWVLRHRAPNHLRDLAAAAVLVPVTAILLPAVAVFGWTQAGDRPDEAEVVERAGELSALTGAEPPGLVEAAVRVHRRTVADNVDYTRRRLAERGHVPTLIGAAAVAPPAFVGLRAVRSRVRRGRLGPGPATLIGVAAAAPLGLMAVGHDWARWIALAVTNLLLLALFDVARRRAAGDADPPPDDGSGPGRSDVVAILAVVVAALVPAIHWSGTIPRLEPVVELVRSLT